MIKEKKLNCIFGNYNDLYKLNFIKSNITQSEIEFEKQLLNNKVWAENNL